MVVLTNHGNNCYFNVIIQIFVHIFDKNLKKFKNQYQKDLYCIYGKICDLNCTTKYDPKILFNYYKLNEKFKFDYPNDVHEVLLSIFDTTDCDDEFKGELLQIITSVDVPHNWSWIRTVFLTLDVPITSNDLYECLDEYFKNEIIENWETEDGSKRDGLKSLQFSRVPKYLSIVLKQYYNKKHIVKYPLILDIERYVPKTHTKNIKYVLKMVIIHKMGHYYIYCNECIDNEYIWFLYNDTTRIELKTYKWLSDPPYMLIYKLEEYDIVSIE
tara:strand:- start:2930 stop:3742 length:813 start_codon:yes stop_codon:yes gene_type:complete